MDQDRILERVRELLAAEYAEQRSQEWLDLRENMITASDIASAIGESQYESIDSFVKKKVLRTKWAGNAATAHGTLLEPLVRDMYDEMTGRKSHEIGLVQHRQYPWLGASPDGVTEDGLLIEIKCPLTRKIESKVPKHYYPQVQLQLEITDLEECDFVQYRPQGTITEDGVTRLNPNKPQEFVITRIKRDREWFKANLPAMQKAWDRIVIGRTHGLCEIKDESPPVHRVREEICCEIKDERSVSSQEPLSAVQGLQDAVLLGVHSVGVSLVSDAQDSHLGST
jgi:putative phage-type endonuclease